MRPDVAILDTAGCDTHDAGSGANAAHFAVMYSDGVNDLENVDMSGRDEVSTHPYADSCMLLSCLEKDGLCVEILARTAILRQQSIHSWLRVATRFGSSAKSWAASLL